MKLPNLGVLDEAGIVEFQGRAEAVEAAAAAARLRLVTVDLARTDSKGALLAALADGLGLPPHFGGNWDALADCLEDRDWLGGGGIVIHVVHSARFRRAHPHDWEIAEEILAEAAEFWRERQVGFWIVVG